MLDFGRGNDRIDLTAFTDIQSVDDLVLRQQADHLVIDLAAHGGGTVTLQDVDGSGLTDAQFVFFTDDA